jgi:hypothetical protein
VNRHRVWMLPSCPVERSQSRGWHRLTQEGTVCPHPCRAGSSASPATRRGAIRRDPHARRSSRPTWSGQRRPPAASPRSFSVGGGRGFGARFVMPPPRRRDRGGRLPGQVGMLEAVSNVYSLQLRAALIGEAVREGAASTRMRCSRCRATRSYPWSWRQPSRWGASASIVRANIRTL